MNFKAGEFDINSNLKANVKLHTSIKFNINIKQAKW